MIIREAQNRDIPTIIDYQMKLAQETESTQLDPAVLAVGVAGVFQNPNRGKYFVAEEGGDVIGCLLTTYEWSDLRNGTVLWIASLYIAPEWRGKGVYKQLYAHIQELIERDPSLRGIRLYVHKTNKTAKQIYAHLGMTDEHYLLFEWTKETDASS